MPTATFAAFADDWMKNYVLANNKPSEVATKVSRLKNYLTPFFGHMMLAEIGEADIERYKADKRAEGSSPKSVNNHLAILGRLLRTANEWGRLPVVPRIKPLKVPPQRVDYLSSDECSRLVKAASQEPFWCDMVICALRTGLRRGEMFGLEWRDIDFDNRRVNVQRNIVDGFIGSPKSNRTRFVPLTPDLAARFVGRAKRSGLVFGQPDGRPLTSEMAWTALGRIAKRANLRHIGWHTLRHTYATQLVGAGVSIRTVQELLGHSDIKMTMRYAHVAPDAMRDAVKVLPPLWQESDEKFGHALVTEQKIPALKAPEPEVVEALFSATGLTKTHLHEEMRSW